MRNILVAFFFFFFLNNSYSQQITTRLYGNIFSFSRINENILNDNLSFALEYKTKSKKVHEFEVLGLNYDNKHIKTLIVRHNEGVTNISAGNDNKHFYFSSRYKYKTISFIEKPKVSFFLYTSQLLTYEKLNNKPLISSGYHTKNTVLHTAFSVIPSVNYNYKNLIFINFNIPVDILSFGIKKTVIHNPALPVDLQTITNFYADNFFPFTLYVKMGIGFRIYEKKKSRYRDVLYL